MKDLISINALTKEEILSLLKTAEKIKKNPPQDILKGKIMASCFFEPSTRTRLSFESAMKRLGGEVIGFSDGLGTSIQKGESLHDAMKVMSLYSDITVIRHPLEGSARLAAEASDKPVVNAGDGSNEHPTQTLLDLFSIQESQGKLEGLKIAFVGDLLHGRTVHSLVYALKHFDVRLYFVAPQSLPLPESISQKLRQIGVPFSFHESVDEVIGKVDVLYMTRIQKERFASEKAYSEFVLTKDFLEKGKDNLRVLHPLPRVSEIDPAVDQTKYAYYFTQAQNGLYVRQALLAKLLEEK